MNDALADNFMAPLREAQGRLAQLNAEIANKQKELAALQGECAVARKAMNELGEQRIELQGAVNSNRALLSKSQTELAKARADFDELRKKVASLPTMGRARGVSFYDGEGELNGMAILTDATVREIKALYLTGKHSYEDLAKWFGVKKTTVFDVISTKHWDHLLEPGEAKALERVREQRRDSYNFKHRRRQYG